METDVLHGEVLPRPVTMILLVLSMLLWYALHWTLDPESGALCKFRTCCVSLRKDARSGYKDPCGLLCQRRKLKRMTIYCTLASLAATIFLVRAFASKDAMEETCCGYTPGHQVAFAVAAGHWIVDVWEDWCSRDHLGQGLDSGGLTLFPLNLCCKPYQVMLVMYTIHHVVTAFAYCFALLTHSFGGVCVQGLLFELPVVLMSRRDLAVILPETPNWLLDRSSEYWKQGAVKKDPRSRATVQHNSCASSTTRRGPGSAGSRAPDCGACQDAPRSTSSAQTARASPEGWRCCRDGG